VDFDSAFRFAYSMRETPHAHRWLNASVPADVKQRRLVELIDLFRGLQLKKQLKEVGREHVVLVDGIGKKRENQLTSLTDTNKRTVFD
jgi:tRNA-2-methylthio-N6-dimethylallyladenosine synthase